ncbi:HAD family hydrolase [Candidatus Bipolaricaulota bacterium]|nr:HAD family hydrolase [Candidatus Bipolaricaulota bacterium]
MGNGKIKAVFLDMDGTLVHFPDGFHPPRFLQRMLAKLGYPVELVEVERAYRETEDWENANLGDFTQWTREKFVELNRRLLGCLGIGDERVIARLAEQVEDMWERLPEEMGELLYPEVPEALRLLRDEGIVLGIVSHRTPSTIRRSVERHGISGHFTCFVSPLDAAAPQGKLNLEMWTYALEEVEAKPHEVVHIGDVYEYDVVGPRAAGITPILLNRDGVHDGLDCLTAPDLLAAARLLAGDFHAP